MCSGGFGGVDAGESQDITEAELLQVGQMQATLCLGNMQQGIGIAVAITGGVRQGADADAIKDDEDDALNGHGLKGHELSRKIRRKESQCGENAHQLR
jgi:hypothetical protein